jgi:hypothetical protein
MNFPLRGEERLTDPGARLRLLWEHRNIVVMPGVFNAARSHAWCSFTATRRSTSQARG